MGDRGNGVRGDKGDAHNEPGGGQAMEHFEVDFSAGDDDQMLLLGNGQGSSGTVTVDREESLFSKDNIAIPIYYCTLGFMRKFIYVALRIYLRDSVFATPSQQALVYAVVIGMPWNLKAFMGFVSDSCPIRNQRRKPYMFGGMILCSSSWILFGILPTPSLGLSCVLIFFAVFGLIFADVMADALVVEIVRKETCKGGAQSTCWMLRFSGSVTGFLAGGWLLEYAKFHPQTIFFLQGLFPLIAMLPPLVWLHEPRVVAPKSARDEAWKKLLVVWEAIQYNHIWMPMCFIFAFAATPNNADAFANWLLSKRCFTDAMYTYLLAVGYLAQLFGAWLYKRWLRAVPFRRLFFVTLILASAFSSLQLVVISGFNRKMGIPDFVFAMGDEVVTDAASFVVQMPTLVLCAALCPPGVESTLYALLTMVNNIALSVGGSFSGILADSFGVTLEDYSGLFGLTLVTSLSTLLPTVCIPLMPSSAEDAQRASNQMKGGASRSRRGSFSSTGEEHLVEHGEEERGGGGEEEEEEGEGNFDAGSSEPRRNRQRRSLPSSRLGGMIFVLVLVVGLLYSIVNAGLKLSTTSEQPDSLTVKATCRASDHSYNETVLCPNGSPVSYVCAVSSHDIEKAIKCARSGGNAKKCKVEEDIEEEGGGSSEDDEE